jgi:hypothetical protein
MQGEAAREYVLDHARVIWEGGPDRSISSCRIAVLSADSE